MPAQIENAPQYYKIEETDGGYYFKAPADDLPLPEAVTFRVIAFKEALEASTGKKYKYEPDKTFIGYHEDDYINNRFTIFFALKEVKANKKTS
jgi:hypothetical protein